jgi:dihydroorotase
MQLVIPRPDDFHVHFRDGDTMESVVPYTARQFGRALVMPNLKPPVVNVEQAIAYKERIESAVPEAIKFQALMSLYLTDDTVPQDIIDAQKSGVVFACKLYPAGATTNSASGVTNILAMDDVFAVMAEMGILLLLHGEVTDSAIDIFDRERTFLQTVLAPLLQRHPTLRVVLEHITTAASVRFVEDASDNLAATITPHHLLVNRNVMLVGGIKPHYYCLPILKRETDRVELLRAAVSGNPKFFLGTDSAPHAIQAKESSCGCAGCFTAQSAIELYATAFEEVESLNVLAGFASRFGADFYGLPYNSGEIILSKVDWVPSQKLHFGEDFVRPFSAGKILHWKVL